MATIYRFIVENKYSGRVSGGRNVSSSENAPKKATGKGKWVSLINSPKGGVEHNRKMRAINPLLNKATGGYWEKGMRLGRAGAGLVQKNTETGQVRISGPAIAIIIAMIIQSVFKIQKKQTEKANKENAQNYKAMENGVSQIHGQYTVDRNFWDGKATYNENK